MKHKKVIDKKARQEVYINVASSLQDSGIPVKEQATDAHLFLSVVVHNENKVDLCGGVEGGEEAINRMLSFFLRERASIDMQKAFLTACAIYLRDNFGNKGEALGFLVGNFVEEDMGGIECNCEECQAAKRKAQTDINVN